MTSEHETTYSDPMEVSKGSWESVTGQLTAIKQAVAEFVDAVEKAGPGGLQSWAVADAYARMRDLVLPPMEG
jgi:hypothetical protein